MPKCYRWLLACGIAVLVSGCSPSSTTSTATSTITNILAPPATTPPPAFQMSPIAENIVTDAETSSGPLEGHSYYDKHYQTATFAGSGSGATVAIGVDLGQNTSEWTTTSWSPYYNSSIVSRLAACSGDTSVSAAKADIANLQDIIFPWNTAINEFNTEEVPNYYQEAVRVFPGLTELSINAQSAICSICYNRGFSMVGASRVDMRTLRTAVANKDYQGMHDAILNMDNTMRSAWESEGIYDGMVARRAAEAQLVITPDS